MTVTACYRAAGIADSVAYFNHARNWTRPLDPFALDLDGDGLESTGDMGRTTVLFDHDGDGILAGTGWLRGDDAWLVLDRDGDNRITRGAQLFGVDTPLASGLWDTVTLANSQRTIFRDGFSAIAPLDTNRDGCIDATDGAGAGWSIRRDLNGDGVIGANETRLAQSSDLPIWRDLNVNGRTDAGELMSFTEANVVSINVHRAWQGRTALGNGNELIATGAYTRTDNTTRGTGALNLGVHSFYRSFSTPQNVASSVSTLPTADGSGAVRNSWCLYFAEPFTALFSRHCVA
jgi:hypothetical protein